MNETKSVKVDNWGVFFLQKLQNFFNRTDHCDLTLQFNDNSQLKVHRLVLSACTDYFNLLEQQCEMIEDILIMPDDLQADVIVPIVNFMYTGTLEFQYSMFDKLLKTANDMNMTVLLKLLEAHRSATRNVKGKAAPVVLNKQAPRVVTTQSYSAKARTLQVSPQTRTIVKQEVKTPQKVLYKHHQTIIKPLTGGKMLPEPVAVIAKYSHQVASAKGPTRFELDENTEGFEGQFDAISYESKPLLTAEQVKKDEESSLFEKLKKDVHLKRPAASTLTEPIAKKLNLDDVKELSENIRLRKQLAEEEIEDDGDEFYQEDPPFEDDEDDVVPSAAKPVKTYTASTAIVKPASKSSPKTTISIREDGSNMNHAKIISEVLKKYPHLVKNNKNIKLKILQKSPEPAAPKTTPPTAKVYPTKIATSPAAAVQAASTSPASNPKLVQKIAPQVKPQAQVPIQRPKRIDAKTMHELIAKGAENTTGPWLCLRCGIDGRPISIPSYKSFRNHLIAVHKEKIDARLCEECGQRSTSRIELLYHGYIEHQIQPPKDVKFPACATCGHVAMTPNLLQRHGVEEHGKPDNSVKQIPQCTYCGKPFMKETTLNTHIKAYHREQAILDGLIEDPNFVQTTPANIVENNKGIKVLASITIPASKSGLPIVFPAQSGSQSVTEIAPKLEPSSEAEALNNVASGIATSLTLVGAGGEMLDDQYLEGTATEFITADGQTRLVTADGSELQLSAAQKEEILSQLQGGDGSGNVIMVLNHENYEEQAAVTAAELTSNPNIMVVYSQQNDVTGVSEAQPVTTTTAAITAAYEESTEAMMNELEEKPENVEKPSHITKEEQKNITQDLSNIEDESMEEEKPTEDSAEKAKQSLISTLQGDWSDDDEDIEDGDGRKRVIPAPALFEDQKPAEEGDHETDARIAEAVGDIINDMDGEFKAKEKIDDFEIDEEPKSTLISVDQVETADNDADKDQEKESPAAEKEICRLVDEWDDDL